MKKSSPIIQPSDHLSTGSTLLNMACTGNPFHGFSKGHYFFLVGDSISGKTFLSLTCLAEASQNPHFDHYRFIYDNGEDGALMDIEKFFGKKLAKRLEPPSEEDGEPSYSLTVEDFYFHVDDAVQEGQPFIYVLDSMDSLTSRQEGEKFEEVKEAVRKGRQVSGSYGDGKAKINSANLRRVLGGLRSTGSILLVLNQTRDNLGFGFEKKTRSGGHALRFYACIEIWSSVHSKITKTVRGKKRQLGIYSKVQIKKNRITGRERTVTIPIYHSYGIDDIGSCIDYLVEEGYWKGKGSKIQASEFDFVGSREKLVELIEEREAEMDLRCLVGDVWRDVEKECELKRKKRYE